MQEINTLLILITPVFYFANQYLSMVATNQINKHGYGVEDQKRKGYLNVMGLKVLTFFMVVMIVAYFWGDEDQMQFVAGCVIVPILWGLGLSLCEILKIYFRENPTGLIKVDSNYYNIVTFYNDLRFSVPLLIIAILTNHPIVWGGIFLMLLILLSTRKKLKKQQVQGEG